MEAGTHCSDIKSRIKVRMMTEDDYQALSNFSCGEDALDNFFHSEVKECVERRYLAAYSVLLDNEIVGAFTLMNDALMVKTQYDREDFFYDLQFEASEDMIDFFLRQSSYPAVNIGHLGTSCKYQSQGIGSVIIDFVVATFQEYRQSGCQFLTVDALNNPRTNHFYIKKGFNYQTNCDSTALTRRMYRIL